MKDTVKHTVKHTRRVFKKLRQLQDYAAEYHPHLNQGGCGVFAHLVGEQLQKRGWQVEVVTPLNGDTGGEVPANIRGLPSDNSALEWDAYGLNRNHLALRFKTPKGKIYTYDSDVLNTNPKWFGERGYDCSYPFGEGLTVKETKEMCSKQRGWNSYFSRREIPSLKKKVKEVFKDI